MPKVVNGDHGKTRQIVSNLISNAIKFTQNGEITVSVMQKLHTKQTILTCIQIQDNGIGMSQEQLSRLFQPFSQADSSITRRFGGSGLGLMITKQLTSIMGGSVEVTSVMQRGSTFTVTIPFLCTKGTATFSAPSIADEHIKHKPLLLKGKKILIADDNELNQKVVRAMLQQFGCDIDIAHNGKIAEEKFKSHSYDLVFMDCHMPEVDGFMATKAIRLFERKSNRVATPIIALTADAMSEARSLCLDAGMNDVLTKPLHTNELTRIIAKFFNHTLADKDL